MFVNARAIIERSSATGTEILVQVRNKPREGRKSLELPGGQVRDFESLVEALRREVKEETGLDVIAVEGLETRIATNGPNTSVECLTPLAVYQTLRGPVDSMGVYFRCRAEGELLAHGDESEAPRWVPVSRIRTMFAENSEQFSWVDRAGLQFYLNRLNSTVSQQQ